MSTIYGEIKMYIKIPLVRYIVDMRYNLQCSLESKVRGPGPAGRRVWCMRAVSSGLGQGYEIFHFHHQNLISCICHAAHPSSKNFN